MRDGCFASHRLPRKRVMKLSDDTARKIALDPGQTDKIVFDDEIPGFGVRVRAGGRRTWIAQYRIGRISRRITIGKTLALPEAKARKQAKDIFAKVQLGDDPQADRYRKIDDAQQTFEKMVDQYLDQHARPRLRPRSLESVERHLQEHWKPFQRRSIHDIKRKDVASRLLEIASQRGEGAARRARATLSAFYTWAMRSGVANENPVINTIPPGEEKPRDRVLSDAEIATIWKHSGDGDYGAIVKLLILTAQRRDEVGHMLRSEIDTDERMWSIPGSRTKNGEPHQVPLSDSALDILNSLDERDGSDHVFGIGERGFSGWSRAKAALDKRISDARPVHTKGKKAAPMAPWRLHDLRRSTATRMAELGTLPHVVEAVLNHLSGSRAGVAGIYNRATYLPEKRQALDMWAAHIEALVAGKPGSNVVAIGEARK
jgi:integrase